MGDDKWRDQEETVIARLKAHADVCLVQRDELTWKETQKRSGGEEKKTKWEGEMKLSVLAY